MNSILWDKIVQEGKKKAPRNGINSFNMQDIETVIATMEFFGATQVFMKQAYYDLRVPKFRFFDWLAMVVMGRNDDDREQNGSASKVLVYAFENAGYDERVFIDNLRSNDYEMDTGWEKINLDK